MRFTIKNKTIAIIISVVSLMLVFSLLNYFSVLRHTKNNISRQNLQVAANISKELDSIIDRSHAILTALSRHPAVIKKDSTECDTLFASLLPSYPLHLNILAAGMDGYNYCSAIQPAEARRLNYIDMEWFQKASKGSAIVGNMHISKLFKSPAVMIAMPVIDNKKQVGVIGLPLNLAEVRKHLFKSWTFPDKSTVDIVDSTGKTIICIYNNEKTEDKREAENCFVKPEFLNGSGSIEAAGPDRIKRLYSFSQVEKAKWSVIVGIPVEHAYKDAYHLTKNYILITIWGAVLAFVLSMSLYRNIIRNLSTIKRGMDAFAKGDLSHDLKISSRDELKDIADAFNIMTKERKKSELFIKNILESVDEGFIVISPEYKIISANKAYLNMVKKSEEDVIGSYCYEVSHHIYKPCCEAGEKCPVMNSFVTGEPDTAIHVHYDEKDNMVFVEAKSYPMKDESGQIISVIEILNNITEKKKLEDQLRHAQKMEAIGTLTGGIAHDFNNILTAIIGYGNVLKMKMQNDDPLRLYADHILGAAERAANLTQSLLAFSRKQPSDLRPADLNNIVKRVEKLLHRVIGEDIELKIMLADKTITVMADSGQLEQVLMNLATNARDAMPEGGILTITTEIKELDAGFYKTHGYGSPGAYAMVSVSDSGIGMDEQTREKIFEPFFTTKEVGKGTGLGLSIAYGIIKQHNGYIDCHSEPGRGTTFKIYLPLIEAEAKKEQERSMTSAIKGGTETILIAEDEPGIRKLLKAVLEEFGYRVIDAVDGEDAVNKFIENKDKIDFMLFDLIMPKIGGREAYERIRKIKPGIKTLFASAYPADIISKKLIIEEGVSFIPKPVSPKDLLNKIREMLDTR